MQRSDPVMEETERDCCIRGYHVYKDIWEAAVGESLTCERETNNPRDRYAVAVKKEIRNRDWALTTQGSKTVLPLFASWGHD